MKAASFSISWYAFVISAKGLSSCGGRNCPPYAPKNPFSSGTVFRRDICRVLLGSAMCRPPGLCARRAPGASLCTGATPRPRVSRLLLPRRPRREWGGLAPRGSPSVDSLASSNGARNVCWVALRSNGDRSPIVSRDGPGDSQRRPSANRNSPAGSRLIRTDGLEGAVFGGRIDASSGAPIRRSSSRPQVGSYATSLPKTCLLYTSDAADEE